MRTTITLSLLLALFGCDRNDDRTREGQRTEESVRINTESAKPAADNTEKNERDRESGALTPGDQGESEADREVTRQIRQNVVGEEGLSMNAKNVKIITKDGVVTLRGPVESAGEKARIGALAQSAPGVQRVENQLEVTEP